MKTVILLFSLFCASAFAFNADVDALLKNDNTTDIKTINLANFSFKERDQATGLTPLAYAIQYKKMNWAGFLISHKLGINTPDYLGRTPLFIALQNGLSIETIKALISNGANLRAVDKSGRSIESYLGRTSKEVSELVLASLKESPVPTTDDLQTLKQVLIAGDSEKLNAFAEKFRSIDFSIDQIDLNDFLIDSNAIEKWSFENLITNGLNIFKNNFAAKVARAGKFNFLKEMMLYRFDFSAELEGKSILEILLEKETSEEILKTAVERTSNLKKINSRNENYAALALRFKRYEIVKLLVSKNVLLEKADDVEMAIKSNDRDLIKTVIVSSRINLNTKTSSGIDLGKILAKSTPDLVIPLMNQYKESAYDLSTIKQDVPDLNKASQISVEDLEKALNRSPKILPGNDLEEQPFETGIRTSKDLDRIDNEVGSLSFSLIGERKFDEMIESYVNDHILELREKYEMTVDQSNSEIYQKLSDINGQIEKTTQELNFLLKSKEEQFKNYSKTKVDVSSIDLKKDESIVMAQVDELVAARKNLINLINKKKQYLNELAEEKNRVEAYINMFKKGNAKVLKEIEAKRNEIGGLKGARQKEQDVFTKNLEANLKTDQERLDFSESLYSESLKKVTTLSDDNQRISRKLDIDNQSLIEQKRLENDPNAPAHRRNGHNPQDCIYIREAKRLSDEIAALSNQMQVNEKLIKEEQPVVKKYKEESDYFRNLVSRQKEANQKEINQNLIQLDKKYFSLKDQLERQLSNLEMSKDLELSEFVGRADEINKEIAQNFSDPQIFENVWAKLETNLNDLNNAQSITQAYINLNNNELKETPIGSEVFSVLETLYTKTQAFEQKSSVLKIQSSRIDHVDTLAEELSNNDKKIDELKNDLDVFNNEKEKIKIDIKAYRQNSSLQEILDLEEMKYLEQFGLRRRFYDDARLQELKANNPSIKDLSFDKFAIKSPKIAAIFSFNDIETDNEKLITSNKFQPAQYSFILQKWHEKILANYGQGDLFRDQQNAELFSRALEKKVSFQEVSDGKSQSLKVLSSYGDFYLSKRGLPYSADENDPYKFEFLSTGENRELIEQSLETIKQAFPKLTAQDLKKNFDLHFLITLLKYADKINDIKKTKETIVFVADIVGLLKYSPDPAAKLLAKTMGIIKCGADVYERASLEGSKTWYQDYKMVLKCAKSIMLVSSLDKFVDLDTMNPTKLLVRLAELLYTGDNQSLLRKTYLYLVELLGGKAIDKLDKVIFAKIDDEFNQSFNSILFLRNFTSLGKKEKMTKQNLELEVEPIKLQTNLKTSMYLTNGFKIIDTCRMNREMFLDVIEGLKLFRVIDNYENIELKKDQVFYKIMGDSCLIIAQ